VSIWGARLTRSSMCLSNSQPPKTWKEESCRYPTRLSSNVI